ncbi:hypothetical protein [Roseicyclus mahoneyensis]|nr:hypothetical protein [Roseicyclus mahoneyensis]
MTIRAPHPARALTVLEAMLYHWDDAKVWAIALAVASAVMVFA